MREIIEEKYKKMKRGKNKKNKRYIKYKWDKKDKKMRTYNDVYCLAPRLLFGYTLFLITWYIHRLIGTLSYIFTVPAIQYHQPCKLISL